MGLADVFGQEDRAEIKVSQYLQLIKESMKAEMLLNGVRARLPHSHIIAMAEGCADAAETLKEYEETGLAPDRIREMDAEYLEKCKEVDSLQKALEDQKQEREKLEGELTKLEEEREKLEEELQTAWSEGANWKEKAGKLGEELRELQKAQDGAREERRTAPAEKQDPPEPAQKKQTPTLKAAARALVKKEETDRADQDLEAGTEGKQKIDRGKIQALRAAGWTLKQIGEEMGVSAQTIANRLKEMGMN